MSNQDPATDYANGFIHGKKEGKKQSLLVILFMVAMAALWMVIQAYVFWK